MKKEDCFAYDENTGCIIFGRKCKYSKVEKCSFFYPKKRGFPNHFYDKMNMVNAINQSRAIVSQKRFNLSLAILTTIAIIIAVVSFVK